MVLAGGRGTRLAPLTVAFPKPLVPVGDVPTLDILVRQLEAAGVERITMAVGHLAELIMAYFSGGDRRVSIDYSREEQPLGTAGPLTLVPALDERFLVMNGDVLCSIDYNDLVRKHVESGACATVAAYSKQVQSDLGVLEVDEGGQLVAYHEKPTQTVTVSMGIYVFEPEVLDLLEPGERCDLPDLVSRILEKRKPLYVYPFDGYWLDIGRPEDYTRAVDEFDELRSHLLPGHRETT